MQMISTLPSVVRLIFPAGLALVLILVPGCQDEEAPDPASSPRPPVSIDTIDGTGTEKMRAVLAALNERAHANPMEYFHLNGPRAQAFKERLEMASYDEKTRLRYQYAYELLYAGEVEEAIRQLNTLIQEEDLTIPRMGEQTKPIFHLLGLAYLRLGERENCIKDPSAQSCILPIRGAGVHMDPTGSRNAAEIYEHMS